MNFQTLIVALTLGLSLIAHAENPVLVGIRGNEPQTAEFAKKNNLQITEEKAIEFSNGNTFVRFKTPVENRDMIVLLPQELNPNTMMETLLKLHTARLHGGRSIALASPVPLDQIKTTGLDNIDLERFFKAAGANRLAVQGQPSTPLGRIHPRRSTLGPDAQAIVVGNSHPELARETAELSGMPYVPQVNTRILEQGGKQVYYIAGFNGPFNDAFFKSLGETARLAKNGNDVAFVTPYLPYSRSDKIDQPGITIGGKLAAELIEAAGAGSTAFISPHAPQSQGFFKIPTHSMKGFRTLIPHLRAMGVEAVISPDEGFQKRATEYSIELGVPVGVINQRRDPVTTKKAIYGYSGDGVAGKTVVITDDETETGGTLAEAAALMKTLRAKKVIVAVSAVTGTAAKALGSDAVDQFVVLNTVPFEHEKVKSLSIAVELAESMQRLEEGRRSRMPNPCSLLDNLAF